VSAPVNVRLATTKAVLWLLVGVAAAVAAVRYALGLGLTTALSDQTPWGLWIGLDVMAGVALAAGGFVIAASVYVFHRERFHALVRPAVLTAFLGYVAVVLGLLIDLGRPWNIWRMTVYWQPTSALFEVGWCVMLYLSVLTLEFAPVVFEGLRWSFPRSTSPRSGRSSSSRPEGFTPSGTPPSCRSSSWFPPSPSDSRRSWPRT
jgi:Ni/Fe-hydrogenase subunit HybB-like protein